MQRKIFRWVRFGIICLLVVALPGCVEVRIKVDIARDGSGVASGTVAVGLDVAGADQVIAEVQQKMVAAGWSAEPESGISGKRALRVRHPFRSLAELGDLGLSGSFAATGGPWSKQYVTHLTSQGAGQAALFELIVEVPGHIVETNGTKVGSDTVKWDLTGHQGASELTIRSSGLAIAGPLDLAKSLIESIDSGLENASAKSLAIYSRDGYLWAINAASGGSPAKLWPDPVESFTVARNGLVAIEPKSADAIQGDVVLVSASSPGKAVLKLDKVGYEPTLSPDGSALAFVRPTERFSKAESEELAQPEYAVCYIFISQPAGGVFQQMAAQEKLDTVRREIDRGADFVTLARQYSEDRETAQYGSRSTAQPRGFRQGFGSSLLGHHEGDTFGPVKAPRGWYFLKVEHIYRRTDLETIPAKRTEVVVRDLSNQQERIVPFHPEMFRSLENWNDHLQGWATGGRGLRIVRTWFPPKESEIPSWLWISGSDTAIDWAADILADGKVVRTGDGGDFAGLLDPRTKKSQLVPDDRRGESGGNYAVSPSGLTVAFWVARQAEIRGPQTFELRALLGSGNIAVLDRVETRGPNPYFSAGAISWLDDGRLLYSKKASVEADPEIWFTTLSPGSAKRIVLGSRPTAVRGAADLLVFARGKEQSEVWSGKLDGSATRLVDGAAAVSVARIAGVGPALRRAIGYGAVGLIGAVILAAIGLGLVLVAKRLKRASAGRPVVRGAASPRYCRQCGAELTVGVRFCQKCGKALV